MGQQWYHDFLRYVDQMDAHEWVYVLAGLLVVGFVCLRGLGSRSSY